MRGKGKADTLTVSHTGARVRREEPGRPRATREVLRDPRAGREQPADPGAERERPAEPGPPRRAAPPTPAPTTLPKEEVVARLFEAFSRRDVESALALVHPEVVFEPMTAAVTRAGESYRGHEGIRRYAQDVESHWEVLTVHPAQVRAAGRAVVALGLVSGRGPGGSFEDAPTTWVVKFRDGVVAHAQIFSDARNVVSALVETGIRAEGPCPPASAETGTD
jgi:ketosteroid isomerase-like protein